MIEVKKNDQKYVVIIEDGNSSSEHFVTLNDEYYKKLTGGKENQKNPYFLNLI